MARCLVNMSAGLAVPTTLVRLTPLAETRSCNHKYWVWMWRSLPNPDRWLIAIAADASDHKPTLSSSPKLAPFDLRPSDWLAPLSKTYSSTSALLNAMMVRLDDHGLMQCDPKNALPPLVDLRDVISPAQSLYL